MCRDPLPLLEGTRTSATSLEPLHLLGRRDVTDTSGVVSPPLLHWSPSTLKEAVAQRTRPSSPEEKRRTSSLPPSPPRRQIWGRREGTRGKDKTFIHVPPFKLPDDWHSWAWTQQTLPLKELSHRNTRWGGLVRFIRWHCAGFLI
jgi:hypothetical protein